VRIDRRLVQRWLGVALLPASALACVPENAGYDDVRQLTADRVAQDVRWAAHESSSFGEQTNELLAKPLTADAAVQVALYNNRALQGAFEELGVARGHLLSALALPNPSVGMAMRFSPGEDRPELDLDATISLSDLLFVPWKKGAGDARLDAAKVDVAGRVVELAFEVRAAYFDYQAAEERLELLRTVLQALKASVEMTEKLHEAGNITELRRASEQSFYEEARIEFARAESELHGKRERLNALMGIWGSAAASWKSAARLPEPQPVDALLTNAESRAVEKSLDLELARRRYAQLASEVNVSRAAGWLPELRAGVSAERQDTEWAVGPVAEVELPLFDHGQGETAVAAAEMRRQGQLYADTAVRLRARVRSTASRLSTTAKAAEYYRTTVLPLRERVLEETQLQYNAMSVGVFALLQAKRESVTAASRYIELVHDYWTARTELEQMLAGHLPSAEHTLSAMPMGGAPDTGGGH